MALVAWYADEAMNLGLETGQVLTFAVAHDLVEAYAGDTDPPLSQLASPATKDEREAKGVQDLQKDFREFGRLAQMIETYEASKEKRSETLAPAPLVYAVDKLLVFANTAMPMMIKRSSP